LHVDLITVLEWVLAGRKNLAAWQGMLAPTRHIMGWPNNLGVNLINDFRTAQSWKVELAVLEGIPVATGRISGRTEVVKGSIQSLTFKLMAVKSCNLAG
jgi:hypothetical protein